MKYPCELIKDLMPIYVDELASEESRRAVDEHLAECDSCRKYADEMKTDIELYKKICNQETFEIGMQEALEISMKKLNTRTRYMIICFMLIITLFCFLGFAMGKALHSITAAPSNEVQTSTAMYKLSEIPYGIYEDSNTQTVLWENAQQ